MTVVDFHYVQPDASGDLVASSGWLVFTPTRRRVDGDRIVLPAGFRVELDDEGRASVDLAVTDHRWVWLISEDLGKFSRSSVYVAVPDSVDPVLFQDLLRVDPSSLDPVVDPDPAWWSAVDEMIVGAGVVGDDLQLTRQSGDTFNAGHVKGDKGDKGDEGDKGDDGATIVDDATAQAARGYRDEAQVARTGAETAATSSADSAGDAKNDADRAETEADRAKAEREATEALGITVDNSAGTKVTIGSEVVSYDSGWRDIWSMTSGIDGIVAGEPQALIRRVNNEVFFQFRFRPIADYRGTSSAIRVLPGNLPGSFTENPTIGAVFGVTPDAVDGKEVRMSNTINRWNISLHPKETWTNDTYVARGSYTTGADTPTSLPGTPA